MKCTIHNMKLLFNIYAKGILKLIPINKYLEKLTTVVLSLRVKILYFIVQSTQKCPEHRHNSEISASNIYKNLHIRIQIHFSFTKNSIMYAGCT